MNRFFKILLIFIYFQGGVLLYAQTTRKDSIQNYFKQIEKLIDNSESVNTKTLSETTLLKEYKTLTGEEKAKNLLNLYTFYKYKNASKACKFNNEAIDLSKAIAYKEGNLQANYNKAYLLFVSGDFDESTYLLNSIDTQTNDTHYPNIYSDIKCLKSLIHTERGEYDVALDVALKLLDLGEKAKNNYILMKAHGALLHYYIRTENYEKALNHCLKGLDYTLKNKEVQYLYFKVDEIARILANLGDTNGALQVYNFYLKLENKMKPPGDYIQSIVYMNMANIYTSNNQLDDAQNYIKKALTLNYKNDFRFRIPRAQILQAELYLKTNDTNNAISFYEKSLYAAEAINAFDVVQSTSKILGDLYEAKKETSKAFEYKALHNSIKDSLFSNEKEQKIVILEAKRKIKEITQKQEILALENEAQRAKIHTIIAILIGILILGLIATFSYLKVKNKNKLLYKRTVELAKIQLDMRNKISELERLERKEVNVIDSNQEDEILRKSNTNNTIDENVKTIILNKLNKLEQDLFFINQNCTLRQTAQQLKTNPKYLSQVINQEKKSNFSNYINELRINYLLAKLLKEKDFRESKLSYIAVSVGFNNLNTFNAAFKKRQGILPSYFIKELTQEANMELA
ncbi:helix-turn-helix domain-containing protein [Algibacter sp. PT7-4]|uniref:helix-turn-helix domain-containing protein n=1 Tax=Algibacter ulvanivorans TaxID=3400999 RepID=UPI003AACBB24